MYDSILSMPRSAAGDAFTDLVLEVFRLNGRLLGAGDALTRPVGQSSARWQVLGALDGAALSVADISRRMGLACQSVQRTADVLERDGLVSYEPNPVHRRAKLATLTSRGRAALDAITTRQVAWANAIARDLREDDLRHARRTLERVRHAVASAPTPAAVKRLRSKTKKRRTS